MKINESLKIIQEKLIAPKGQTNAFGKYKYRSCEDILEAVKPLLKETGTTLIIRDDIVQIGDRHYVKAMVDLCNDESAICVSAFARECSVKKGMDEAQITGAASSYARKYALNGLFCIDDTKDPDTQDNRNADQTHKDSASEEETNSEQDVPLIKMVMDLAKNKFKELDDFKAWRIDNSLPEDLYKASNYDVSRVIAKLKEIKT